MSATPVLNLGNVTQGTFGGTDVSGVSLEIEFDDTNVLELSSGAFALLLAEERQGPRNLRPESRFRGLKLVAGGRYARVCEFPVPLMLPVIGWVGASDGVE